MFNYTPRCRATERQSDTFSITDIELDFMMSMFSDLLNIEYVLAVLIFLHSIPSLWSLVTGKWRIAKSPNHGDTLYEDEDGVATTESTQRFSNKAQIITIFAVLVIGFGLAIADFICLATTVHTSGHTPSNSDIPNERKFNGIVFLVPAWVWIHSRCFA